jgi:hypothetical protein
MVEKRRFSPAASGSSDDANLTFARWRSFVSPLDPFLPLHLTLAPTFFAQFEEQNRPEPKEPSFDVPHVSQHTILHSEFGADAGAAALARAVALSTPHAEVASGTAAGPPMLVDMGSAPDAAVSVAVLSNGVASSGVDAREARWTGKVADVWTTGVSD